MYVQQSALFISNYMNFSGGSLYLGEGGQYVCSRTFGWNRTLDDLTGRCIFGICHYFYFYLIYHSRAFPSAILLPVARRALAERG